jgi:RND family efflux transporter MFP subunit
MRSAVLAVALATILVSLVGCKSSTSRRAPVKEHAPAATVAAPAVPVSITRLTPRDLADTVEVTGSLQAVDEVQVGPRFAGRIAWIVGDAGTRVARGDVVARTGDEDAHIQIRGAKSALQAAQARFEQTKAAALQQVIATDSGISNAEAALDAAIARRDQAKVAADAQEAIVAAGIKAAEASRDAAKSRLVMLRNGARPQERKVAEGVVSVARETNNLDRQNYERYKGLFEKGAVAKSVLDTAEAKFKVSQAQLESALQQLDLVKAGPRLEEIETAEATVRQTNEALASATANLKQVEVARANVVIAETGVAQAKAALAGAKAAHQTNIMRDKDVLAAEAAIRQAKETLAAAWQSLDYTNVYSPVDGVIAERVAQIGQSVGANVTVLKITTNAALRFEAKVSELEATRLRRGQAVRLSIDALGGDRANSYTTTAIPTLQGRVEKIIPVVDARTRNFLVRVLVPRRPELFPGMFARGQVVVANYAGALAVPKDAIVERDGAPGVFIVSNGTAQQQRVTLGMTIGTLVHVRGGLRAGDEVITSGQQSIRDGDAVKTVVDHNAAPPAE